MKKILLILAVIVAALFLYIFQSSRSPFMEYELEGKTYKLMKADSREERAKGLMNYRSKAELNGADGMIFIFPEKSFQQFWNENTYLDLEVYWLDGQQLVGKNNLPSIIKTKDVFVISSPKKVDRVIEIVK